MKKNSLIFIAGLVPLIPCSSRFGYALFIVVELWFLFFSLILAKKLIELLTIKKYENIFMMLFVVLSTSLFASVASCIFPIAEFTLRFFVFLLSVSYILFFCFSDHIENYQSFSLISFYSGFVAGFALLRELLSRGAISFLSPTGFFEIHILPEKFLIFNFLGSNIGTFFLLAIIVWIYFSIKKSRLLSFMEN